MTASANERVRALALATVMVFSVFAVVTVPADAKLLSGGNASVSQTGSADDVVVNDATIDTTTSTTIEVAYDTTLSTSDIAIEVRNDDTGDVIATKTSGFTAKEDVVTVTIPDSSTAGVPDTSDFSMKVTLADSSTSPPTPMASDTAAITVEPAPSISGVALGESSGDMAFIFDSDEQLGTNAGDIAVTVSGPNGATYSFDRTDFAETDNGDGTYTYTLATTQAYDDGDGTYTASVDDALDPAGANGGGSGLSATYDYSSGDATSPTISNVNLGESSGDLKLSFDSDEQLGGNAGDLTVTVDSPNTGTDWQTFDRTDFSETQNKDGSYTYSLSTTQAYDDGDGVYTAEVDDAKDSAGNNGGINGDGSGLSDSHDTSDSTAPTISSVSFTESSGKFDISFDADEQLGTSSGDVTVEVTGPNGATKTFDRSQFSESGSGPYTYTFVGSSFDDGDGTYTAEVTDAKDSAGNNGGTNGAGSGLSDTYDYSDTTAPSISSVTLKDSGSGTLTLSFVSDEQLDSDAGDIKVSVDAPNAGSDWKVYYRNDFVEKQLQSGNYKYTLLVQQGFDSGTGTYTLTVDDAKDGSDNNGGENGQGSGLTDTHSYDPGSGTPEIVSKDIEYESGPAKFQTDADVEKHVHWNTMLTSQSLQFNLWVDGDEITLTDSKRDLTLSPVGFTDTTNITLRMTVKNYDPDVMMGPANVSSWSVNDKSGSKKEIVVTLKPSVVQRNFNAPFSPSQWDESKQSYKESWEQADVGVDAFVGLQTAQLPNQGGISKLSGARLNTDAQAFTTPSISNGRLVFNVAAPHCKVGAKTDPNDPAADDECNEEYVNDDGFYEAVIPKAFWKDQWGSDLNPDNMSIVYKNGGTEETLTNIEITKRQSGALYIEAKGIHYSSGDLETVEDTTDPTADAGSDVSVNVGTSVSFDGTSSSDSETSVTTYKWDVDGDGTYEKTGSTPSYSYSSPGTYTVTLKVEDGGSNTETDTLTVTVTDATAPTASVGSDTTVTVGTEVTFDGSGSTDNVGVTSYEWDVDGDGSADATGATPSYTFSSAGTYDVELTVKDSAGNTATATRTVTVADKSVPTASVGADTTIDVGEAVTFDGSGSADNDAIASYEWDFDGDGTVDATGATATHTYDSAGTYTATLTVTDSSGNTDTATRTVTVAEAGGSSGPPVEVTAGTNRTDVVVRSHSGRVSVDLARTGSETGHVSADAIAFQTTEPEAFTLNVSTPASAAEAGVPDPEPTEVGTLVGYVQVDHSVSDDRLSDVTLNVTVGWDALTDRVGGGDIVVYRYHDGEWQPLETEIDHYSDRGVHLTVESPGLSVFAVGSERQAAFTVSEGTVDAASVATGESVTVAVPVTNDGTAVGETTLELASGDRTLTVETVRLLPGQSTTVELTATFDDPGEYELRVGDRSVGTVTVSAATAATATPESTATPDSDATATPGSTPTVTPAADATSDDTATPDATPVPDDDADPTAGSGPGFGLGAALLAVALAALAARRRR